MYFDLRLWRMTQGMRLSMLGGVVGDSAVNTAFAAYARAWRFKHPSPWDFFMFMDHQLGKDLGWFWNAWWFTTETFDQGLASVHERGGQLAMTVADHGTMAMPVLARIAWSDGTTQDVTRPASVLFAGHRTVTITVPTRGRRATSLTLDPENRFQDLNRTDNSWQTKE